MSERSPEEGKVRAAARASWLTGSTCTAILLAGGRGRRVSGDKAGLVVGGAPLFDRALATLDRTSLPVVVALRADQRAPAERRVVRDPPGDLGPLGGLVVALEAIDSEWAFVFAVDMPLLVPEVVPALFRARGSSRVVVPRVAGRDHVLASLLHRDVAPLLRAALATGERGVSRALAHASPRFVDEGALLADADLSRADPSLRSFTNVNTPDDVARVEALLSPR